MTFTCYLQPLDHLTSASRPSYYSTDPFTFRCCQIVWFGGSSLFFYNVLCTAVAMPGGSHFNTWGLAGSVLPLGGLTINNSVTIPHSHNISDGESDSGTARTGNQVGATHFGASRSRAHDSGVLTSDYFNDTPYVPPRPGQSLPQAYLTHTPHSSTRAHGIPSVSIPSIHFKVILFYYFSHCSTQVPQSLMLAQTATGAAPHLPIKTNHTHHIPNISNIIHRSLASHLLMSHSTCNSTIRITQLIMVFIAWALSMLNTHSSHPPVAPPFIIDHLHDLHINPTTFLLPSSMNRRIRTSPCPLIRLKHISNSHRHHRLVLMGRYRHSPPPPLLMRGLGTLFSKTRDLTCARRCTFHPTGKSTCGRFQILPRERNQTSPILY